MAAEKAASLAGRCRLKQLSLGRSMAVLYAGNVVSWVRGLAKGIRPPSEGELSRLNQLAWGTRQLLDGRSDQSPGHRLLGDHNHERQAAAWRVHSPSRSCMIAIGLSPFSTSVA